MWKRPGCISECNHRVARATLRSLLFRSRPQLSRRRHHRDRRLSARSPGSRALRRLGLGSRRRSRHQVRRAPPALMSSRNFALAKSPEPGAAGASFSCGHTKQTLRRSPPKRGSRLAGAPINSAAGAGARPPTSAGHSRAARKLSETSGSQRPASKRATAAHASPPSSRPYGPTKTSCRQNSSWCKAPSWTVAPISPECEGPSEVLERLSEGLSGTRKLRVLGATRLQWNRDRLALGETLFPHKSVDAKWWREYVAKARVWNDPVVMLARVSLAPFTWSESQRALGLVGAERWVFDLCVEHGIRDGLTCPIGGRWMVSFWSPQTLLHALSPPTRAALYAAASCAAVRLEQLLGPRTDRAVARPHLTPRELAVLRWASAAAESLRSRARSSWARRPCART